MDDMVQCQKLGINWLSRPVSEDIGGDFQYG